MKFALILACLSVAVPRSFAFQSGASSLEGQVVSLTTGAPVRHATVNLYPGQMGMLRPGQPQPQYTAKIADTDDQGRFTFQDLAPGGYRLTAQRQGFAGGNVVQYPQTGQLFVGAQQQLKGVVLKLAPQSVVAGKVFDRDGEPLERAQVSILRPQPGLAGSQWMTMNSVQTNDLGEFRIAGMSAGRYRLSASYRDYRGMAPFNQALPDKPEMSYVTTYYGDTSDPEKAQFVTVSAGGEAHADIHMQMTATVRIRGRVIDPDASDPNQTAWVSVVPKNGPFQAMFGGGGVNRADGSFELPGVPPGDYYLLARKNGTRPGPGNVTAAIQPITVGDKNIEGVAMTLTHGRDVRGTVQIEGGGDLTLGMLTIQANSVDGLNNGMAPMVRGLSGSTFELDSVPPGRNTVGVNNVPQNYYVKSIRYDGQEVPQSGADLTTGGALEIVLSNKGALLEGHATDSAGKPAVRATIGLFPAARQPSRYEQSTSDGNGEFRFRMLPPGEYKLIAWESAINTYNQNVDLPPQFESRSKTVKLEAGGSLVTDVTVIPAAEFDAATGTISPAVEFPNAKGSVQGQVVRAKTGEPVKNALVHLNSPNSGRMFATASVGSMAVPRNPSGKNTHTDEEGNFAFSDVEPGTYQLGAEHQGFINGLYGRHPDMNGDSVIVGEGQAVGKLVVRLEPQAVLAGRVTDEYGDPVVNVPVSVTRAPRPGAVGNTGPGARANTNSLGEFRIAGLAAGAYILAVRPTGPLTTAELAALPLPDRPEMRHPVTYYPNSLDPAAAKPIVVESGAEVTGLDVKLQKTAVFQIRGTMTGLPAAPQGAVARPAIVMLYPAKSPDGMTQPAGSAYVRPNGDFTIAGVLPGPYLLTARSTPSNGNRMSAGALQVEVKDQHLDGLHVALEPAKDVQATVTWEKPTSVRLSGLFINLQSVYPIGSMSSSEPRGDTSMVFHNVLGVPYKVSNVSLPPGCFCFLKSLSYGGRDISESGADLTTGLPLAIVLSSSAAIVEGTVVDRQGKPAGGAAFVLVPKDSSRAKIRTGFTDDNGKFYFENNPPGEYRLLAWEDVDTSMLTDASFLAQFESSGTAVKLEALGRQTVRVVAIPAK